MAQLQYPALARPLLRYPLETQRDVARIASPCCWCTATATR